MCTVAFIPSAGRYFFASLRDENPARLKAEAPLLYEEDAVRFLAPKDPKAGGTWAGINRYENVIILLNGGFENHESTGQYRKSRGLIVNELLKSVYPVVEWSVMDMEGIEPYTLIIWSENNLFQLVWDGRNKHRLILDPQQPAIWSSSTLYSTQAKEKRKSLFDHWVSGQPFINPESFMNFFQSFHDEENGFLIHRAATLKTLSYSFIELSPGNHGIYYYDDFSISGPETKQISTAGYTPDLSVLFSNQDLLQRKK
jgi:hypothetical protein